MKPMGRENGKGIPPPAELLRTTAGDAGKLLEPENPLVPEPSAIERAQPAPADAAANVAEAEKKQLVEIVKEVAGGLARELEVFSQELKKGDADHKARRDKIVEAIQEFDKLVKNCERLLTDSGDWSSNEGRKIIEDASRQALGTYIANRSRLDAEEKVRSYADHHPVKYHQRELFSPGGIRTGKYETLEEPTFDLDAWKKRARDWEKLIQYFAHGDSLRDGWLEVKLRFLKFYPLIKKMKNVSEQRQRLLESGHFTKLSVELLPRYNKELATWHARRAVITQGIEGNQRQLNEALGGWHGRGVQGLKDARLRTVQGDEMMQIMRELGYARDPDGSIRTPEKK